MTAYYVGNCLSNYVENNKLDKNRISFPVGTYSIIYNNPKKTLFSYPAV